MNNFEQLIARVLIEDNVAGPGGALGTGANTTDLASNSTYAKDNNTIPQILGTVMRRPKIEKTIFSGKKRLSSKSKKRKISK